MNDLKERTGRVVREVGVPITALCRKVGISGSAYYRWKNGNLALSVKTEQRIADYVEQLEKILNG